MQRYQWSRGGSLALSGLLLALSAAPVAAQEFEGVFTSRVPGPGGTLELKTSVKGARYRMDVALPGQGTVAMIGDPAAGEIYLVMAAQQMIMVMKLPEGDRASEPGTGTEASFTATGRKEVIAGHNCEYFRFTEGTNVTEVCFASDLGAFRGGASLFGGPPGRTGMPATPPWARELLRKGAFPLKVARGNGEVVWEVVAVERKSLEAALFTPPANYQRMTMPSFGRPPAG